MQILEILGKIGFDWKLALANLVNIAVIFFVLQKYAFKPIAEKLKEREAVIKQGLSHAHAAEASLKDAEAEKEEIVAQAKRDALLLINDADVERKKIIADAHIRAETERQAMLEKAEQDIEQARTQMTHELEKETGALIVAGVRRILKEEITPEMNERIIRNATTHG